MASSNLWERGRSCFRRRLAKNPMKRMRTKPRGRTCNRKRRRNSSLLTHRPWLAPAGVALPPEGHLAVRHVGNPVVGNGRSMGVTGQVMENMLRSPEGRLGVPNVGFYGSLSVVTTLEFLQHHFA
jgi:hypothetical protein